MRSCVESKCNIVSGIDLAGSPKKPTGIAIVKEGVLVFANKVFHDDEIIDILTKHNVCLTAIDAPLSLARSYRKVDIAMRKRGYKVLPPGWRGMRALTLRAIRLKRVLESLGIHVIETHPSSAIRSSGLYDIVSLINFFVRVNNWDFMSKGKDVIDAVIAACVAWSYVMCKTVIVKEVDGEIYLLPHVVK